LRVRTEQGQRPSITTKLLPLQVPCSSLAKGFSPKDATDPPGINIGFQTLLMRTPHKLGETALVKAVILFREGEDDRGKPQACDLLQIMLEVLGIAYAKVAHTKLHRQFSPAVSGRSSDDFRNTQFGARTWSVQIEVGVVTL
jgi:hypothetical protein